ncbi:MAG: hypothetical protein ACTSVB_08085 [Candidatus Heimdallarchaeaceae archaeon]
MFLVSLCLAKLPSTIAFEQDTFEQATIRYNVWYYSETPNTSFENVDILNNNTIPDETYRVEFSNITYSMGSVFADMLFVISGHENIIIRQTNITNRIIWTPQTIDQWIALSYHFNNLSNYKASIDYISYLFNLTIYYEEKIEKITVDTKIGITTHVEIIPLDLDENKKLWIELQDFSTSTNNEPDSNYRAIIMKLVFVGIGVIVLIYPIALGIYKLLKLGLGRARK